MNIPKCLNLVHRDLKVQLLGDSAIVTFQLGEVPEEHPSEHVAFSRRTFELHVVDGAWKIVHFHGSNVTIPARTGESR